MIRGAELDSIGSVVAGGPSVVPALQTVAYTASKQCRGGNSMVSGAPPHAVSD